jgi:hypothetical protein
MLGNSFLDGIADERSNSGHSPVPHEFPGAVGRSETITVPHFKNLPYDAIISQKKNRLTPSAGNCIHNCI